MWNQLAMPLLLGLLLGAAGATLLGRGRLRRARRALDEERHARQAAERAGVDHQVIFDASPAFIWYKDRDNRILRVNQPAAAALGLTPAQIEGRPTAEFYPADAASYYADDLEVLASGAPKLGIIETLRPPDSELRWVRTDKIPSRDAGGAIVGVVVFALDITEQKRAELDLEAALAAKRELLAFLSHELRTPLSVMIGFAELLASGGTDPLVHAGYAERIVRQGQHLATLIDEILDLAKAERTVLPVALGPVALGPLLADVLAMLEGGARDKGVALHLRLDASAPEDIVSDPRRLQQILINVIANAVKFTTHGEVRIHAAAVSGRALLAFDVSDTGIGLDPEAAARLFEPFYQARPGTHGTGLGLALSKKLALALGGDLVLVRSAPQAGSTFRITVGLAPDPAVAADHQAAATGGLAGRRVLVVSGDPGQRGTLLAYAREQGGDVIVASDAPSAAAAAAAHAPDLTLLDLSGAGAGVITGLRAAPYAGPIVGVGPPGAAAGELTCLASTLDGDAGLARAVAVALGGTLP